MRLQSESRKWTLPLLLVLVFVLFLLLHDLSGGTLLDSSSYNSYVLQAEAWSRGRASLDRDYPWLELAVYGGRYYVPYPPVPSAVLFPAVLLAGTHTPDNLIICLTVLLAVSAAYLCLRKAGAGETVSAFWSVFAVLGSSLLSLCTEGTVWSFGHALNAVFCLFGILSALHGKRILSLTLVALAAGCRLFSVLLLIPLLVRFFREDREKELSFKDSALSLLPRLILPALVLLGILAYNYVRFHSPFEFGWSFLGEAGRSGSVFSISCVPENLKALLSPVTLGTGLRLSYNIYGGFLFLLANPFLILLFFRLRKPSPEQWTALGCMVVHLFLLLCCRNFGGWQFGSRLTLDLIPYAFLILLPAMKKAPRNLELFLGAFAVLFNLYGAVSMRLLNL